jgi:hypothetical protein
MGGMPPLRSVAAAMTITLKREAKCHECGARLAPGTRASWHPNGAVYGLTCHARRPRSGEPLGLKLSRLDPTGFYTPDGRLVGRTACGCEDYRAVGTNRKPPRAFVRCPVCERAVQLRIGTTDPDGLPVIARHNSGLLRACRGSLAAFPRHKTPGGGRNRHNLELRMHSAGHFKTDQVQRYRWIH